ncbi:hypothetical protein BG006_005705 [Podila minutissima]|uniref:Uncharacterized protein n=1 Tax=Podila minutissima TaxID=64525 RepID=A0A9P5SMN9_9FUNG|nr:hypothetical protein BG006_005705 [Podila minutissima]
MAITPTQAQHPSSGYTFQDNDQISIHSPKFAHMLWHKTGLRNRWFETSRPRNNKRILHAVGLSSNIRFYQYTASQSFGAHYGESVVEDLEEGTVSEYTALIYFNGERDSDLLSGGNVFDSKGKKPIPDCIHNINGTRNGISK